MFKRIKENSTIQKFKELWNNPKIHSLMVLGLWLVFIVVAILITKIAAIPTKNINYTQQTAKITTFENLNNYEFTYQIDDVIINGQAYNDKLEFYLGNKRYYYNQDTYLIENGSAILQQNFDINILKISGPMLNNLTNSITPTNTTTYQQYLIPLDRFINLYDIDTDMDLSKAMNYNIIFTLYKDSGTITKATLDLTNYRLFKTGNPENYLLTIYYYNVNNVSNFTTQYETMIGGKK